MKKLVLDSNIINFCQELDLNKKFFNELGFEIWIPTYVINEVQASNKEELINILNDLKYNPTGFFGFSDNPNALGFDKGIFFREEHNAFINNTVKKHQFDRYISLLSKLNNAIFITNDKKAYNDAIKYEVNAIKFETLWTKENLKESLLQQILK